MKSELTQYVRLSPNCTRPRNHKIDAIVIHHAAGTGSVEALGSLFAQKSRQASANYGVDSQGRIACFVEEENRAFTTSNAAIDHRAITIEVSNSGGAPNWPVSDQALEATIALCTDICRRYGFRLNYTGDKDGSLHMHRWYVATACPGPYLSERFPYIAQEVQRRLDQETVDSLPVLKKGAKGESVKALQLLLIGRGYSCGQWGADGDFGNATESALAKYRKAKGLTGATVADETLWLKLLGVVA